ncbi:hypothetical protein A1019T_00875 [Psychrobacter pasteurii]|uniref:Uncharacterized protein n=1 Tax=Psychrobacter pasteurii TaxID=1945520 RepID=A0A1R4EEK0_9GAMM|nr:hypothetical protein [Psychrobacter pasteurii]SJM36908.1 hypothetical protein A1019T_00875 [Psychrobacter pasteurii]
MSNEIQNQDANDLDKALEDKQEPDSLAEATTAALDEDALGGHATEADRPKK